MSPKAIIQSILPPPRRPVTIAAPLPLIVFIVLFLATCWLLDLTEVVLFTAPGAFALVLLMPWIWWMHEQGYSGLVGVRSVVALLIRLALVALFIMILARPNWVTKHEGLSIMYVLDVSASIDQESTDLALRYITRLASSEKPQKDEAGLVVFGRDAAVELPPSQSFPFDAEYGAVTLQVDRDGTNVEKALSLAAAVLPDENDGRIVLISDGVNTEGDLTALLDELKARNIAVDVLRIDYNHEHEVWVERLELPKLTKIGESYEAVTILSSLQAGEGELVLKENGRIIARHPVTYQAGKNRYSIPIYLRQAGYYEYEASIEVPADKDGWRRNNRAISYLHLQGQGKVLVVQDPAGDPRDWEQLVKAMRDSKRKVEMISAFEFPTDPLSLLPYDCIVFPNVPADAFAPNQLEAVQLAVKNQGTGFLMVGGENSFGPGGYNRTPIEEILPVMMDVSQRKVLPKGALVICLHTCEFPQGNTWGKNITKQAINVLGAQDEAGVLVFDFQSRPGSVSGNSWLFKLTPVAQRTMMFQKINNAQIGDMPSFAPTMNMALKELKASDASVKHMIIISDGDPSPPPKSLLQQFVQNKITVSTVAVFPHGNSVQVMQLIAQATRGNFYFPKNPNLLPAIFIKEAKTLRRSMIQNKTFTPRWTGFPSDILKGITDWPELHGYVLTSEKKGLATTILRGPEKQEIDPVLAIWRYGTGVTAAFTSDLSPNWAKQWVNWEKYQAFVSQLMSEVSRRQKPSDVRMQSFAVGNRGIIVAEDYAEEMGFLDLVAQVNGPRGKSRTVPLTQVGPRRYEAKFDLWGEGRYQIIALGSGDGRAERIVGGFVVPYSHEYMRFHANPIELERIANRTGGRILNGTETGEFIYGVDRQSKSSSKPKFGLLLIVLACLVPLDVAVRRIQLDMHVIKSWFGVTRAPRSEETFSNLLRRKRAVASTLASDPDQPRPLPVAGASALDIEADRRLAGRGAPAAATKASQVQTQGEEPEQSTTGRLLALKRRIQDENKDRENTHE